MKRSGGLDAQRRRGDAPGHRRRANSHAGKQAGTGLGGGRLGRPGTSTAGRRSPGWDRDGGAPPGERE